MTLSFWVDYVSLIDLNISKCIAVSSDCESAHVAAVYPYMQINVL